MPKPHEDGPSPRGVETAERTASLAKQLEEDLEQPVTEKLLPEIHELQRSLNSLESEIIEDDEGALGEGC